jgi:hypothetical protein
MKHHQNQSICDACFRQIYESISPQAAGVWLELCDHSERFQSQDLFFQPNSVRIEEAIRDLEVNEVLLTTECNAKAYYLRLCTNDKEVFCPLDHD